LLGLGLGALVGVFGFGGTFSSRDHPYIPRMVMAAIGRLRITTVLEGIGKTSCAGAMLYLEWSVFFKAPIRRAEILPGLLVKFE